MKKLNKYHPDLGNTTKFEEENFKKVTEAYEVLGNNKKKAKYDYLIQGRYDSINGRQGGQQTSYYKTTQTYTKTYGKTTASENVGSENSGSAYGGNYYEDLKKREHYRQQNLASDKNLLGEAFVKIGGALIAFGVLKSVLSFGGRDSKQSSPLVQHGMAPFATTSQNNDEKFPYDAFTRPGGKNHTISRPKTEIRVIKSYPKPSQPLNQPNSKPLHQPKPPKRKTKPNPNKPKSKKQRRPNQSPTSKIPSPKLPEAILPTDPPSKITKSLNIS
eukprot:CAMPEP_0196997250 /NCGR_PEP_ID=MMETSP1380-20130617/2918_1 /TAXON_ID=5936 /ORGANISM="Euplotes crassus, Strain CT5" /LENGTH=272 /DNA_ID=CAMNT_0042413433 /DNA_START=114 /DNA_END=933 /DNA_ORIENTATION=-